MARLLAAAVALAASAASSSSVPPLPPAPSVSVTGGLVSGVVSPNGALAWLGIPFAAPPTGALRFAAPAAVLPWAGTRDGSRYGSDCVQFSAAKNFSGSEDCLFLNVYAPPQQAGDPPLPVHVWVHGGGMCTGGGGSDLTDYALATRSVIVSVNYRLGLLGFSPTAASVAGVGGARSNVAVLDWIAALAWVRFNIGAFGGDVSRVTVSGQSAGGANMMYLLTVPAAYGLYDRLFVQSPGTPTWNRTKALAVLEAVAEQPVVACPLASLGAARQLACLRAASPEALVAATGALSPYMLPALGPNIDGELVLESPRAALAAGRFNPGNVTVVVSACENEGSNQMLQWMQQGGSACAGLGCVQNATAADYDAAMDAFWAQAHQYDAATVAAIKAHYAPPSEVASRGEGLSAFYLAAASSFSEGTITCNARSVAQAAALGLRVFRLTLNESVPELGFTAQPIGLAAHNTDTRLYFNGGSFDGGARTAARDAAQRGGGCRRSAARTTPAVPLRCGAARCGGVPLSLRRGAVRRCTALAAPFLPRLSLPCRSATVR